MNIKKPLVSIIIRTFNEERWIEICLKKIYEQKLKNFEVIIVDNNSTDKTLEKAKQFHVKITKIKNFLPGRAINQGIKISKGKYIVCLSAHCIPTDNFWLECLVNDLKNKKIAGVYGRQFPLNYSTNFDKRDLLTFFGLDRRVQKKDTFFHNANSAFRKSLWKKFPFDEKTRHIEDRIWAHKLIKLKYNIIYEPKACVYHWHGINQNMNEERCSRIVKILEELDNDYQSVKLQNINNLSCMAIIPQRGESIKLKNQEPLIQYTIKDLKESLYIKNIYVATDSLETKKIAIRHGVEVPFLRTKESSDEYVDVLSTVKFFLKRIEEEKKIFPDIIVIATENFPYRPKKIFDEMIKKVIDKNYDVLTAVKNEKGSVFIKQDNKTKKIVDGLVPSLIRDEKVLISRIGISCVIRTSNIRSGNFFSGKIGYFEIKDPLAMTEINQSNIKVFSEKNFI